MPNTVGMEHMDKTTLARKGWMPKPKAEGSLPRA